MGKKEFPSKEKKEFAVRTGIKVYGGDGDRGAKKKTITNKGRA